LLSLTEAWILLAPSFPSKEHIKFILYLSEKKKQKQKKKKFLENEKPNKNRCKRARLKQLSLFNYKLYGKFAIRYEAVNGRRDQSSF
jgi:hypothetical protein